MQTLETPTRPPVLYWVVALLALIWMLFGVMVWSMDLMTDEAALEQVSEAQRQLYLARPQWLFVLYAVAIFSGPAGAVGLLMRKGWAVTMFAASLAAAIIQFGYTFVMMDAIRVLGAATALLFPLLILAIGIFLLWFSMRARRRGWIGRGL